MSKNNFAYSKPEELAATFKTDLNKGLQQFECDSRLGLYGYNDFNTKESPTKVIFKYLEQFKNPLLQLLLLTVVISLFMKQYDDAISITIAIIIVITVAFVQEYRSEKSLQALNKLVPPTCKTIRDGTQQEFLAKYLVPGDIVIISTGDRVPADLRLVDCHELGIDESNLTGETELALKSCITKRPAFRYNASLGDKINNNNNNSNSNNNNNYNRKNNDNDSNNNDNNGIYMNDLNSNHQFIEPNGTIVHNDAFRSNENHGNPSDSGQTDSSQNMAYMGTLVQSGHGKGVVIATGESTHFGTVFKMMQSEESPKSPLQINMDQLGNYLSIYSIAIIFVIVIVGWLQSRPIVEMFTIGVSLAVAAIPEGLPIVVTVTLALGVIRMAKKQAVVKQLSAVETLGCVRVICSDKTGTLTKNEMTVTKVATADSYKANVTGVGYEETGEVILCDLSEDQNKQMQSIKTLFSAASLCTNAQFDPSNSTVIGQSTEAAILIGARKLGLGDPRAYYTRLEEIPFNSKYKYMAVKCVPTTGNEKPTYYLKGAIEIVLDKCQFTLSNGSQTNLDEAKRESIFRTCEYMENQALRVLAVATGPNLNNLTYLGVFGIHDAPRSNARETIETLRNAGVEVKMVTGDSKNTAVSIAKLVGIGGKLSVDESMSGSEIDELMNNPSMSQLEKADKIGKVSVFYRVSPGNKVDIVRCLQLLGNITAMTGDGVNDSVALKKADIGVAMGKSGTDVCKEAAAVILMDDNLATLVVAIEEGKGIFYNIRNFIRFQLSTSIAALSLIAASTFLHIPNPFNAMQILYINIIMDGPPAQSLGLEKVSQDVLMLPPRNVREPVLSRDLIINVLISASVIFLGTMLIFVSEMSDNLITPRDTTMTFTCFVFFDLFNALSCRSQTKTVFEIGFLSNRAFLYSSAGCLAGQFLLIYFPPAQWIFQTEALSAMDMLRLIAISSTVFFVSEGLKLFKNRMFKRRLFHKTSMYLV